MHAGDLGHSQLSSRHSSGMVAVPLPRTLCQTQPLPLGVRAGGTAGPSPPAAARPGRQPLPGQAPCSLMAEVPSPEQSLSCDTAKAISGQS